MIGDKIVTVDGKGRESLSLPALRQRFKTDAPGTRVRLTLESKEKKREVILKLADLV